MKDIIHYKCGCSQVEIDYCGMDVRQGPMQHCNLHKMEELLKTLKQTQQQLDQLKGTMNLSEQDFTELSTTFNNDDKLLDRVFDRIE